uniref:Uncharacterized protein n=1 Tax=Ficus carica TaxID=3494 RepID=A0AA88ECV0_FICCA|nr:hypothetical protein TIFTF001_055245 [Ficus carica]
MLFTSKMVSFSVRFGMLEGLPIHVLILSSWWLPAKMAKLQYLPRTSHCLLKFDQMVLMLCNSHLRGGLEQMKFLKLLMILDLLRGMP